ncbi:MAG: YetF domain-containing protein [Ornithinimicrobium sp.]
MLHDNLAGLIRVLVVGSLSYLWLIALLRISGKRTLAQLNAFDFIVTVALGSMLATVTLSDSVSLTEGGLALALLATMQFVVAWSAKRFESVRRGVTSQPTVLLEDGRTIPEALRAERISEESLHGAVRSSGIGGMDLVSAIVLETTGRLSVIPRSSLGDGSAIGARQR